ncbi:family 43 glycosylhydrolase [Pedobacter sp. UBA5917]|jgi:beta-xylosidase|uniref:family 43 glycosylhydrolase n=1 Tax=Pedobacter sp. UBA5917 TaxID=1947061 RepID=UPI0025D17BC2|nr:family 43 glycosylhydrolase [Pedobacter sp. UBA5917]
MKEIFSPVIFFIFSCSFPLFAQKRNVDLDVFAQKTGNPIIPGYLADASIFYDFRTDTFLAYGTNDGNGGENVFPAQVWYSKDGKKWTNMILTLPKEWTTAAGTKYIWAPSITYHPTTGKYYLMYSIDDIEIGQNNLVLRLSIPRIYQQQP